MLQPRFAWRTPAHQADVRFLQILCFALYYRSLWASYESLRTHHKNDSASCFFFAVEGVPFPTHHKNDSASCYFFAVEGVPFPTHHENNSLSCYFFMLLGTFCNCVATTLCVANPGTPGRCSLLHLKLEVTVNYVFFKNRLPNARGGVTIRYI